MDEMDVELWGRLPLEIEEQTLALLRGRTLGKARVVCKRWNRLIGSPEFGARWLERARQGDCAVLARRYTIGRKGHGWLFLDLGETRHWYTLQKYSLWKDGLKRGLSVTVDGGLVLHHLCMTPMDITESVATIEVDGCSCAHYQRILVMPNGDLKLDTMRLGSDMPVLIVYRWETNQWEVYRMPLPLLHLWNLMPDQPSVPILNRGPIVSFRTKAFLGFKVWRLPFMKHDRGTSTLFCKPE